MRTRFLTRFNASPASRLSCSYLTAAHAGRFLTGLLVWMVVLGLTGLGGAVASAFQLKAAVLKSDYTYRYFDEEWRYEDLMAKWKSVLEEAKIEHSFISDKDLEEGKARGSSVLILPAAFCLSDKEKGAVRDLLNSGCGVVASAAVGTRDQDGKLTGWDFLEELTGSRFADYLGEREGLWVAFLGNSPLSIGINPGRKMELYTWQQLAVVSRSKDAFWSDWDIYPQKTTDDPQSDVAIVHGTCGNGRIVWYGFNQTEVIDDSANLTVLKAFLRNAVRWAGRAPLSRVWYWPDNHLGTAVFTQDVEYLFANASRSVDILQREGIPGTFFCVTELAVKNPQLVKRFAEIGEVASHTDDHQVCKGQPYDLQLTRLGRSVSDLEGICCEVDVRSFRPPEELLDDDTYKAWYAVGGKYIFGQVDYRQAAPEIVAVDVSTPEEPDKKTNMVIIPRVVRDDHNTLVADAMTDNQQIIEAHKTDLNRIYGLNGLYMFAYHSNLYCLPERAEILAGMAKYAKTLDLWFATVGQVSEWWRKRDALRTEIEWASDNGLFLTAENRGAEAVADAAITIYLPVVPNGVEIESDSPGAPCPDYLLEESKLVVFADTLQANSSRTYAVTLQ